ncbi:hypothetical protein CYMTET_32478, partial [Cymbomonas tetramitiformis]
MLFGRLGAMVELARSIGGSRDISPAADGIATGRVRVWREEQEVLVMCGLMRDAFPYSSTAKRTEHFLLRNLLPRLYKRKLIHNLKPPFGQEADLWSSTRKAAKKGVLAR